MTITKHFYCSKDDFYVRFISSAQGFKKKILAYSLIFNVVEEKHEFGIINMEISFNSFGMVYPAGTATVAYFEENGGTTCNITIETPLSYRMYMGKIKNVFEEIFQRISNM